MSKYKAEKVIGTTWKMLLHWECSENNILQLWLEGSEGRPAKLPDLGKKLHERFFELRGLGKKIRSWLKGGSYIGSSTLIVYILIQYVGEYYR